MKGYCKQCKVTTCYRWIKSKGICANCHDKNKRQDPVWREHERTRTKEYRKRVAGSVKEWHKRDYIKHRDQILARNKVYEQSEKGRIKSKRYRQKCRLKALNIIGNGVVACVRCGCDMIKLLEINHKDGGGRREKRGGSTFFERAIIFGRRKIDDLEITCALCNILHYNELKLGKLPYKIIWDPANGQHYDPAKNQCVANT